MYVYYQSYDPQLQFSPSISWISCRAMEGYSPTSLVSSGDSPKLRMAVASVSSRRQGIFATSAPRSRAPLLQMPGEDPGKTLGRPWEAWGLPKVG